MARGTSPAPAGFVISGFCISGEYLSISVIFRPLRSRGSATREDITACGAEPVPTVWRPSMLRFISGFTPSSAVMITAKPPSISSSTGMPFFTWSLPFMPSFAVAPPDVTATVLYAPDATSAAASTMAWAGAAQNPRQSEPVALFSPAISAALFAKLPPPRWFISPQASSEQSITYSTSSLFIPELATAVSRASTQDALYAMFSSITWADRLGSISWALITQPASLPL